MSTEHLKGSALPSALSDVVGDLADLFQKEMRLARAELAAKFSHKLRAGAWMAVAGGFGFIALLLLVEAAVFAIAAQGFATYWACLMVAAAMAVIGGIAYGIGHADATEDMTPKRTMNQIKQDISTAKGHLS